MAGTGKHILTGEISTGTSPLSGQLSSAAAKLTGDLPGTLVIHTVGDLPAYNGPYEVTPNVVADITLETGQRFVSADIKVNKIPITKVSNNTGGMTVIIGG